MTAPGRPLRKPTVVIDPGHGLGVPGGLNPFYPEWPDKAVALAVGLELRRILGSRYDVHMTREDDSYLDLQERYWKTLGHWDRHPEPLESRPRHFAFVSLHANESGRRPDGTQGRGAIVFRPEAHWLELANAINEPLQDMLRTKHGYAGLDIWAPRTGPYYLLEALALLRGRARHEPPMQNVEGKPPAVLVEVGFLTHPDEAYLLTQPSHHLDLARAIAKGLDTCMDVASRKAVIRGRVVSGERQPLAGVDIRATSDDRYPDNESREVQVFSRADGRFDLTLGVCRWSIVFKDPKGTYEANRLALDPDRTEMDLGDVVLRKPGTGTTVLFGQVFHGTTLGPMQDVLIAARQGEQTLSAVTNERGLFMLRFPGFGKWTVVWSAPGGSHEDVRQEVPADGETLILDLLMRPAGWYAIRGKVIAIQPGFPTLRGLRVVAELAELDVEARTDPQGEFTLKPPYNGSWTLTISDPQGIYESETAEALVTTDRPVEPVPTIHLRRRKP